MTALEYHGPATKAWVEVPVPEIWADADAIERVELDCRQDEPASVPRRGERRASENQATADRAVVADHDRMAVALNDRVIQLIFSASLGLHGMYESATDRQLAVLDTAVGELDKAIREIRTVLFEPLQDKRDSHSGVDASSATGEP